MNYSWAKSIGFGALLWVIMFAVASFLVGINVETAMWAQWTMIALSAILAFAFASIVRSATAAIAMAYGATWVVISFALDYAVTLRFEPNFFKTWEIWVAYAVLLIAPLFQYMTRSSVAMTKSHA